jgi:branched-chain amino acid aminotransferase
MELARDEGRKVLQRDIPIMEVESMREVAACGTAVVVTPISKVVYGDKVLKVGGSDTLEGSVGPVTKGLYDRVRQIQYGEVEDKFGWMQEI